MTTMDAGLMLVASLAHWLYFSAEASLEVQVSDFRDLPVSKLRLRPLVASRNISAICVAASGLALISRLG